MNNQSATDVLFQEEEFMEMSALNEGRFLVPFPNNYSHRIEITMFLASHLGVSLFGGEKTFKSLQI